MTNSPLKTTLFATLGLILGVGLLLGTLELAVRSLNSLHLLPPTSLWEFRARQPAPYVGEDYFSAEFLAESRRQPGGWHTPSGTTLVLPNNFSGQWFNVRETRRVTVGQPTTYRHTLYLLGGSTVYGSEVPDNLTIASQLQAYLNQSAPNTWRVENYGASTVTAMQQLERLKTIPLQPGDKVVFYDGVNDAIQGVFYNNPKGWMVGSNREQLQNLGWLSYVVRAQLWLRDRSALAALLLPQPDRNLPAHLQSNETLNRLVRETTERYLSALTEAQRLSHAQGAAFIHVLQPHLFTKTLLSDYEKALVSSTIAVPQGIQQSLTAAYPAFQAALSQAALQGTVVSHDFTKALNPIPSPYLDFCHITHQGNEAIAHGLADFVTSR